MIFQGGGPDPLSPPLDPHLYNNNLSNLSSIKKTAFTDFKEEFVNRIREKEKRKIEILRKAMIFWGRACFGWVDRSMATNILFRSAYFDCSCARFAQSIKNQRLLNVLIATAHLLQTPCIVTFWMWGTNALTRLRICADSPELLLLAQCTCNKKLTNDCMSTSSKRLCFMRSSTG